MRCSCAHGAFTFGSKGFGKLCPRCMGRMDTSTTGGVSSTVLFRINGALPSVIGKVLCYIYSARCDPPFTEEEVADTILVAKYFGLKFLLVHLYRQVHRLLAHKTIGGWPEIQPAQNGQYGLTNIQPQRKMVQMV